jgi:hypothetical protein
VNWQSKQNPDGGWAYSRGCSWTEPTVMVLLAQSVSGMQPGFDAGLRFVRSMARPDGGWKPQPGVDDSTWVASLVALLPPEALGKERHERAIGWLKSKTGRESSWSYRIRQRLTGNQADLPDGWPWFPGAAAWVIPTAFGILAFERALRFTSDAGLVARIESGHRYLLSKMCADGGWNYGSNLVLGKDGDSYPETTGIALLALHGVRREGGTSAVARQLERARAAALRHLEKCRTAEGIAWLRMGLAAHGEKPAAPAAPAIRTNMDAALTAISGAERNPFLT